MNQHCSNYANTFIKSLAIVLLLTQTTISNTKDKPSNIYFERFGLMGYGLASMIAIPVFILENKNPKPELPTLEENATFLEKFSYYVDIIVGQKRKTRFNEDGTVSKCRARGLAVPYELFKRLLPCFGIFAILRKGHESLIDYTQNLGIYYLFYPTEKTVE